MQYIMKFKCSERDLEARLKEVEVKGGSVISIERFVSRFSSCVVSWEFDG